MPDEPDPPRKFYGFKPREFERLNAGRPRDPAEAIPPVPDPGIPAAAAGRIDLHDLILAGAGPVARPGAKPAANPDNEVHSILRENLKRDIAAGAYDLGKLDDSKRRRRIRNYWIALAVFDLPIAACAYWIGHAAAIPFVCAISAIGLFTSYLTWETFFLRTHY